MNAFERIEVTSYQREHATPGLLLGLVALTLCGIACARGHETHHASRTAFPQCEHGNTLVTEASYVRQVDWYRDAVRPGMERFLTGFKFTKTTPLWERAAEPNIANHLRMYWGGPFLGVAIAELVWDEKTAELEMLLLIKVQRQFTHQDDDLETVVRLCAPLLRSGCFGPTLRTPISGPIMDDSYLLMEYRTGNDTYAVGRVPEAKSDSMLLDCACRIIKLSGASSDDRVSWYFRYREECSHLGSLALESSR